jgi:putative ABC transport system substrate-binding protein
VKRAAILSLGLVLFAAGCPQPKPRLATIGVLELLDSGTTREVRRGLLQALSDAGLKDGVDVRIEVRNGLGDISEVHRLARAFVDERVDLIVASSTQSLQAALIATQTIPIVFTSVANPYRAGAGISESEHLANVTGVASTGPIRQALAFIREIFPGVRRLGTLWTPSEMNSEYYLELAREAAVESGFEIVSVPVDNPSGVLLAAQVLVNRKIEVIYQISDNTTNASFEALAQVADENAIPVFSGSILAARAGASAAIGWDFYDMGYKSGQIVARVKGGESPAGIPFQTMSDVRISLNLKAAARQGVVFSPEILRRANEVLNGEHGSAAADRLGGLDRGVR